MGVSFVVPIYFISVIICVKSQIYGPYGYPPYAQYFPGQNPVYNPYPYQPYVSSQPSSYVPYYGYPVQSYIPQNYPLYPAQTYPSQAQNYPYYPTGYPQPYVPYPYVNNESNNSNNTNNTHNTNVTEKDPYADIKVDIIDIEPQNFHYYKRFFNLEDNAYPVNVIDDDSSGGGVQLQPLNQPQYTVKTESKSYNFSSIPQTINTHDVKSKTYSFKRTFTVDPSKKNNAVINLNFVNGVQITTTEKPEVELADQADTTVEPVVTTEEPVPTTTESEEPSNILTWIV